jgi:hypothetical protein
MTLQTPNPKPKRTPPPQIDGERIEAPRPLAFYPDDYAWHMDFSRGQLRKLPWLAEVHEFMKKATDMGTIVRQARAHVMRRRGRKAFVCEEGFGEVLRGRVHWRRAHVLWRWAWQRCEIWGEREEGPALTSRPPPNLPRCNAHT